MSRTGGGPDSQSSEDLPLGDSVSVYAKSGNNGFANLMRYWNVSGGGSHEIKFFDAGVNFGEFRFSVLTLGIEFLSGPGASFIAKDFPDLVTDVDVSLDTAILNFRIMDDLPGSTRLRATPLLGTWVFMWKIVDTLADTYVPVELVTEDCREHAAGVNRFDHRVTAGTILTNFPNNPLLYDFAVLAGGPILCELPVVDWIEPQQVVGQHFSLVTEVDRDSSELGDLYEVQGIHSSPVLGGLGAAQLVHRIMEMQLHEIQSQGIDKPAPQAVPQLIADLKALRQ